MSSTGKKPSVQKPSSGQKSISSFFTKKDVAKRLSTELQPPAEKRQKCTSGLEFQNKENAVGNAQVPGQAPHTPQPIPEDSPLPAAIKPTPAPASKKEAGQKPAEAQGAAAGKRPAPAEGSGDLVGRRVKVFWPQEREWFKGSVAAFDGKSKHHVEYDDGDKEWLCLADNKWELLKNAEEEEPQRKRKRLVKKSAVTILSSPESAVSGDDSEESDFVVGDDSESEDVEMEDDASEEEDSPAASRKPPQASKRGSAAKSTPQPASGRSKGVPLPASRLKATPSNAKAKLGALKSTPSAATPADKSGGEAVKPNALAATDWERYSARALEKFPFLQPDKIKDAKGRRPEHADYDPRTLWIPPNWFKDAKISEGQRQWWEFKARNFDSVLLFKMGKFYEMFEMDAHTGAEVLGLVHMKGDQPHCGFPEANYHVHAERLARAGLRVVVVEQTETPDQLKARNEERRAAGKKMVGVVNREMVAVLTQGTLTDPEMLRSHADASYVLSIAEQPAKDPTGQPSIGVCAVDCATGQILVGSWLDDDMRTNLRAQLAALRPCELVIPASGVSSLTRKVLMASLRKPRVNTLPTPWSAAQTIEEIAETNYFKGPREEGGWPTVLQELIDAGEDSEAAVSALGGAVSFLRSVLLDRSVVGLARMERLVQITSTMGTIQEEAGEEGPKYLSLDGAALDNLEVLETSTGETKGTLLSTVNVCATPAGRRKLKDWLCQPLGRVKDIIARQDAVQELMEVAAEAAMEARKVFAGVGDLERSIARLCASSLGGFGRDNASVVLYEDQAKKKVSAFLAVLRGLEKLQEAMQGFQSLGSQVKSPVLLDLTTLGRRLPDFSIQLKQLLEAADWKMAEELGRVIPNKGVDAAFDEAEVGVAEADQMLEEYLEKVRGRMKCKRIGFVSLNKDSHVLELPEEVAKGVPRDYELVSQRKGFKRFMTGELRGLVKHRGEALERKETAMAGILQGMVNSFAENQRVWNGTVAAMSELDALMSLAAFAEHSSAWGPICRPNFVEPSADGSQVWKAEELRHPVAFTTDGNFVPNDLDLGTPNFTVITGPNMGGKSTLIRQVCLATQLAHLGSYVPAKSLDLTPADAIFVRMGARDSIVSGQSSFLVELTETAAALNRATKHSIVALDELGRGTSTSDGAAIASAVLEYLSHETKCRGLFATHYHRLSDEYAHDAHVALRHMACHVTPSADPDGTEQVTFLYKLVDGSCPKSYGTNVARLAGLPEGVVQRAAEFAAMLEARELEGQAGPAAGGIPGARTLTDTEKSHLQELGRLLGSSGMAEETCKAMLQLQEGIVA